MTAKELIALRKDELLRSLQESIRIKSVEDKPLTGAPYGKGVALALEHALEVGRSLGLRTENMDGQAGWCEFGQGEEMVAVLGHLDVVPEGEGWSVDPFGGEIKDGKLYGRGSMDDKGPVMAAMYAMAAVKESGAVLSRRIRLILGTNEETGSRDMAYYLSHGGEKPVMGFTPDGEYPVINGEKGIINVCFRAEYSQSGPLRLIGIGGGSAPNVVPDEAWAELGCSPETASALMDLDGGQLRWERTQQGVRLTARGVCAHGSTPEQGENAIGRLMKVLSALPFGGELRTALDFLAEKIGMESDGSSLGIALRDQASGALTLNLGLIQGDAKSLTVRINYRYPVTKSYADCAPALRAAFEGAGFTLVSETHKPSLYVPEDSPLVRTLLEVYRQETGLPALPKCIGGGTYAKAMPNVVAFGPIFPGDEVREHKSDEFIEIDRLVKNAEIMAEALLRLAR